MKIDYAVVVMVTLLLAFFGMGNPAVIPVGEGKGRSFLTRRRRELPQEPSLKLQLTEAAEEDKFDKFLYQCYYSDQPVRSERRRASGPRPRLNGVCDEEALTRDIIPRVRRAHHTDADPEAQTENVEATAFEAIESNYDENLDGRRSNSTNPSNSPPSTFAKADSAVTEPTQHALSAPAFESLARGRHGLISSMYGEMVEREPIEFDNAQLDNAQLMWGLTRFGRFYLKSRSFERFLSGWKRNDSNAAYHITQDDVNNVREEVENGMRFIWLSNSKRQQFIKLVFVRNTLETYAMMREIAEPLGLEPSERRTAEDFLQAMYGYLTAVHESDGMLTTKYSVELSVFASEILSLVYAGCHSSIITTMVDGKEVALGDHIEGKTQLYIESMIILFRAWFKSSKDYIDPAVLSEMTNRFYSYVRPSGSYNDGCEEQVHD
ncbi:hypothetical protein PAPHI01_2003 [Pancytospora philotis]|nr:hypothetical protein PAPHI01_2003 [Pancytospora philotis]